jgi:tRNA(fMet)-specific endonuclease VapC
VSYLLDTNACIALINGSPPRVRVKFDHVTRRGEQVCLSSISMFELWYGVFKSARPDFNAERLNSFLKRSIEMLAFGDDDAKVAGNLRAGLEHIGKPIGVYDLLLAAQAVNRGLTLITANVSEFARVKNLAWQDWSR